MLPALAIDFNSFFASVEQQDRPELRGKPLIVVPVIAETTGAIAISLEAKQYGLKRNCLPPAAISRGKHSNAGHP